MKKMLLVLVATIALIAPTACAKKVPNVDPVLTKVEAKTLDALAKASAVVARVQGLEQSLSDSGVIPASVHAEFVKDVEKITTAIGDATKAVSDPDAVRAKLLAVAHSALDELATKLSNSGIPQAAQLADWLRAAGTFIDLVL